MDTTHERNKGSYLVKRKVNRILLINRRLLTIILVGLVCTVIISPFISSDEYFSKLNLKFSKENLDFSKVYSNPPSRYFGNWFNDEIDGLNHQINFEHIATKKYPSFRGNETWVKVKPQELHSSICQEGCWMLYLDESNSD